MLKNAWAIAVKDITLTAGRGSALVRAALLGALLIVLFSFSLDGAPSASPAAAATIFWLASAFCQTILTTSLFSLEENNKARIGLLLAPMPVQAVWLGKSIAALLPLLVIQAVFLVMSVVFLGQSWEGNVVLALAAIVLVDIGVVSLSALLGSLARGQTARESLCSLVLFPLLIPLFLAGIRILAEVYGAQSGAGLRWLGVAAAFDAVYMAASLLLFPLLYGGDD